MNVLDGNIRNAIHYFKSILDETDDLSALSNLAMAFIELDDIEKALKYLNKSLKIQPDYIPSLGQMNRIYRQKQDYQKALDMMI